VYLAYVAEEMRPYETGVTYGNFLDLDGVSADRVRAAYLPEDCERLVELKNRYDPNNLFRFNRTILPSSAAATASHKTYPHRSRAGSNPNTRFDLPGPPRAVFKSARRVFGDRAAHTPPGCASYPSVSLTENRVGI
jgi:hypothetical protein